MRRKEPGVNLKIQTIRLNTVELASCARYFVDAGVPTSDIHSIVKIILQEYFNSMDDKYKFTSKEAAIQWLRYNGFPIATMLL